MERNYGEPYKMQKKTKDLMDVDAASMKNSSKLTIFSTCKPFIGESIAHQQLAVSSWLQTGARIILIGAEQGTKEFADYYGLDFIPDVRRNEKNTPFVSSIFEIARDKSNTPFLCYLNSDIVLSGDFCECFDRIISSAPEDRSTLSTCRRRNIPVPSDIRQHANPLQFLDDIDTEYGSWDTSSAIDLFLFSRELFSSIPDFAIGRMRWDNWLLEEAVRQKSRIIDCSPVMRLLHPIHGYSSQTDGWSAITQGNETSQNRKLAQGMGTCLNDAQTHTVYKNTEMSVDLIGNKKTHTQAFQTDTWREFIAGIEYLHAQKTVLPFEESIDICRTLLWRSGLFFVSNHRNVPFSKHLLGKRLKDIRDLVKTNAKKSALESMQDYLNTALLEAVSVSPDKKVFVWGAGEAGERSLSFFKRHNIEVRAVIDSNNKKWGGNINGIKIEAPTFLETPEHHSILIVISSMYAYEIQQKIKSMSIPADLSVFA